MGSPQEFYNQELLRHQADAQLAKKQITQLSLVRLAVFLVTVAGIYFSYPNGPLCFAIGLVGVALYLFLIKKHVQLKAKRDLALALAKINEEEIEIGNGNFHDREQGLVFQNPQHHYSLDIDLFGRGSFFQFINRTEVSEGAQALANALTANDITHIETRQEAIKELATLPKWRQLFAGTARLVNVETSAVEILDWLKSYEAFIPKTMKWLPTIFSALSLGVLVLYGFEFIPEFGILVWFLLGLAITGRFTKKTNELSNHIDQVKDTFRQYASLLKQIETQEFSAPLLKEKQELIKSNGKEASLIFKEFSKLIDTFNSRKNILSAVVSNGFMLFDIKQTYKVEQWIAQFNNKLNDWFEVISFFDAYNSLGTYVFNKPSYIFPEIQNATNTIETSGLGHPLLKEEKRIDNDLHIANQEFFIVTGANMAGKSTFLRTVGLHIVMANVGLPICATQSKYTPVKLITSMRTVDSLTDDSSYFFAELTRLKFIIDEIKKEPYFIILDEILKGTNSTDKAIGSKKFVEKLVTSGATGIIATHDLSLCEIEKELEQVKNYYFDAEIINDELHFDYTFKDGICKNMNASFLLKKMEIV
jgi:hypothetical protein